MLLLKTRNSITPRYIPRGVRVEIMDLTRIVVFCTFLFELCSCAVLLNTDPNNHGTKQTQHKKKHPHHKRNKQNDVNRITSDVEQRKSCCKNGGLCFLGSFCKCPKNFYGRYCEYEILHRSCEHILHNHWIRSDCDFCKCFDGSFYCIPGLFTDCENERTEPLKDVKDLDPLNGTEIEHYGEDIKYEDPSYIIEDYYYMDDYPHSNAIRNKFDSGLLKVCLLSLLTFIIR